MIVTVIISCNNEIKSKANPSNSKVEITLAMNKNKISKDWKRVLKGRMSESDLDSVSEIERGLTLEEKQWYDLIKGKEKFWNKIRDSISVPFEDIIINDSISVLLGYMSRDDAFSSGDRTVCFDLTSLHRAYGEATKPVNSNRIDRIFSHEYTHLLSKKWQEKNNKQYITYKEQILWDCLYEGMGMYRSMSTKWIPVDGELSDTASDTFEVLYPIFTERIIEIMTSDNLSKDDEIRLGKGLSRGSMKKKWGALPVGVWIALESEGDDRNLVDLVNKGPYVVIELAKKYLKGEDKRLFNEAFSKQ